MGRNPTISIIGATVWGNRGSEAMLVTTIGRLRESFPDARFNVFSYYPAKDRELVHDEKITILSGKPVSLATRHFIGALTGMLLQKVGLKIPQSRFFNIARKLTESDVLLDIGGITFSDGREKYLPFNILTIWPAMMLGVPVVKLAQAVGPFRRPLNRMMARTFLFRCKHVFARGEKTADFLAEIGFPSSRYDTVTDIAFLYRPEYSLSVENEERITDLINEIRSAKDLDKKILILSPSNLIDIQTKKEGISYSEKISKLIEKLGCENYHYVVIPNATREGVEKEHNNDLIMIDRLKHKLNSNPSTRSFIESASWINYDMNTASIRKIISSADLLITSRYHAMISGICLIKPTLVVGWSHKYEETLKFFGLEDYYVDFQDQNINLTDLVIRMFDHSSEIEKVIHEKISGAKRAAEGQFLWLDEEIL